MTTQFKLLFKLYSKINTHEIIYWRKTDYTSLQ